MGVAPPIEKEPGRIGGGFDRNHGLETIRAAERQLKRHIAAKGRPHEYGILELEGVTERDDKVDEVLGG